MSSPGASLSGCRGLGEVMRAWLRQGRLDRVTREIRWRGRRQHAHARECQRAELEDAWRERGWLLLGESRGVWQAPLRGPFANGGGCLSLRVLAWHRSATGWLCLAIRGWGASVASSPLETVEGGGGEKEDVLTHFQAFCHANVDLRVTRQLAESGGTRRGVLRWEVPAELWEMICWLQGLRGRRRLGVGAKEGFDIHESAVARIWRLLFTVRGHGTAPRAFNASACFRIHKKRPSHLDEQRLVDDARCIHSCGSLPKWFYRCLLKQRTAPPHFAYGAVKARRREAAIATQCIMRDRVRRAGKSSTTSLHDTKNSFCSVDLATTRGVYGGDSQEGHPTREHISSHVTCVAASDGDICWHLGLEPLRVTVLQLMSSMGATGFLSGRTLGVSVT